MACQCDNRTETIDRYANLQLFSLKATIPDFQVIQFNKIILADRPACQIVYNGLLHGTEETTTMKLWVIDQSIILWFNRVYNYI